MDDDEDTLICGQCGEIESAAEIESNGGICNTCASENEDGENDPDPNEEEDEDEDEENA